MNIAIDWFQIVYGVLGVAILALMGTIGFIMSGIRSDVRQIKVDVKEVNDSLLRDYATKAALDRVEDAFRTRFHNLVNEDMGELAKAVYDLEARVLVLEKQLMSLQDRFIQSIASLK